MFIYIALKKIITEVNTFKQVFINGNNYLGFLKIHRNCAINTLHQTIIRDFVIIPKTGVKEV